jgi:hypothetical protein
MYEIDVWFEEKIVTNDSLKLIWSPAFKDINVLLGHCFTAVTFPYLLLIRSIWLLSINSKDNSMTGQYIKSVLYGDVNMVEKLLEKFVTFV